MKVKKLRTGEKVLFTDKGICRAIFSGRKDYFEGITFIEVCLNGIMQFRPKEFIKKELHMIDPIMAKFPRYEEKWNLEIT